MTKVPLTPVLIDRRPTPQSFQVTIDHVRYLSHPVLTASATKETAKVRFGRHS